MGFFALTNFLCFSTSQINNNTDRTLDVVFLRFRVFVHKNPDRSPKELRICSLSLSCHSTQQQARNSIVLLPQGYFNVNGKPLDLEKTTSSVLSVL